MSKYGFHRIAEWTKKELDELQSLSKEPICLALANGDYIVATHKVVKLAPGEGWRVEGLHFTSKSSAIFYVSLTHIGKLKEAKDILTADNRVATLESERAFFRNRLDQAHVQLDEFKIGLFSSRYAETKNNLVQARAELAKTIALAEHRLKQCIY